MHRYVRNHNMLPAVLEFLLRERLAAASYSRVAVQQGRVVGLLLGNLAGGPRLVAARHRRRAAALVGLVLRAGRDLPRLAQFFTFGRVHARLRRRVEGPLGEELSLFLVDSFARGQGVGEKLYADFLAHLWKEGRREFHVYTDSACASQFYEQRGLRRAATEELRVRFTDGVETRMGYLYTGAGEERFGRGGAAPAPG